jgi:DNA-binding NarL/FixJ family response regulator
MLVDEDPTFRLGLRVWLEQLPGFQVVAEASTADTALEQLRSHWQAYVAAFRNPARRTSAARPIDLVILDLGLGQGDLAETAGLALCRAIKTEFPKLPVLILSAQTEPVLEAAARQVGADGYGARGLPVQQLAQLIRQVAQRPAPAAPVSPIGAIPGPVTAMRLSLRLSGLQQIDAAMAELQIALRQRRTHWVERLILEGRLRELRTARWLVNQLWATPQFSQSTWSPPPTGQANLSSRSPTETLATVPETSLQDRPDTVQALVFEAVFSKLQINLDNSSPVPLEIDILRSEKKRELFYLTLRQLENLLDELRQLPPGQLPEKTPQVLQDLWRAVLEEFFGKYYTVRVNDVEQEVVPLLHQDQAIVSREILDQIPLVPELLGHCLFQEPLTIDGVPYLATTPEALGRSEQLLENLLIQVGSAVMQPLLNRLADVEAIKKSLYHRRVMSTREIERFRNELAWRYRWDRLANEPKAIFESQYRLFVLTPQGIDTMSIYAPRREELETLSGLQWAVTMAMETRDAVAPRVRSVVAFVGSGLVYVLTEVVGRGIGLIGRGVLQGIGSAWQDTRRSRRRERPEFNEWE